MSVKTLEGREKTRMLAKQLILGMIQFSQTGLSVREILRRAKSNRIASSPNFVVELLAELEKEGFVEVSSLSQGRGPPKKMYKLAKSAHSALFSKIDTTPLIQTKWFLEYFSAKSLTPTLWRKMTTFYGRPITDDEKKLSVIAEDTFKLASKYLENLRNQIAQLTMSTFFLFLASASGFKINQGSQPGNQSKFLEYTLEAMTEVYGQNCKSELRAAVQSILVNLSGDRFLPEGMEKYRKVIEQVIDTKGPPGSYDLTGEVQQIAPAFPY